MDDFDPADLISQLKTVPKASKQLVQQSEKFNSAQKQEINSLIREYILNNPEIIPEAVEVLRSRQNASALSNSQEQLYNDGYSHVAGKLSLLAHRFSGLMR